MTDIAALLGAINRARDHYDACPVCGEAFVDVDGMKSDGGTLVFIHDDQPDSLFIDGCDLPVSESEVADA